MPTHAHQLLKAVIDAPIQHTQAATEAWLALPLGSTGVAADGETDLTFALPYAHAYMHKALLTALAQRGNPWQANAQGEDAFTLAVRHGHPALAAQFLQHARAPRPQALAQRPSPFTADGHPSAGQLIHAVARHPAAAPLFAPLVRYVGQVPPSVWGDIQSPAMAQTLRQAQVAVPEGLLATWQARVKAGHLSADVYARLRDEVADVEQDPASRVHDYLTALSARHADTDRELARVVDAPTVRVAARGLHRTTVQWSLLGQAWWSYFRTCATDHRYAPPLQAHLDKAWSTLAGPTMKQPWSDELRGTGLLALVVQARTDNPPWAQAPDWPTLMAWSGMDRAALLADAVDESVKIAHSPTGSTKLGQVVLSRWNRIWRSQLDAPSPDPVLDACLVRVMTTPAMAAILWGEASLWIRYDPQPKSLSDPAKRWLDRQGVADRLAILVHGAVQLAQRTDADRHLSALAPSLTACLDQGAALSAEQATTLLPLLPDVVAHARQHQVAQTKAPSHRLRVRA